MIYSTSGRILKVIKVKEGVRLTIQAHADTKKHTHDICLLDRENIIALIKELEENK